MGDSLIIVLGHHRVRGFWCMQFPDPSALGEGKEALFLPGEDAGWCRGPLLSHPFQIQAKGSQLGSWACKPWGWASYLGFPT